MNNNYPYNSNEGFDHEAMAKVAYIFGVIQKDLIKTEEFTWEDIAVELENIVIDWTNLHDIRDEEEEGYIMAYAERVLREKFK
jgi:hypothetical protein